jgi:hypothetical protein
MGLAPFAMLRVNESGDTLTWITVTMIAILAAIVGRLAASKASTRFGLRRPATRVVRPDRHGRPPD